MVDQIVGNAELLLTIEEVELFDRQAAAIASGTVSKIDANYQYKPNKGEQCSTCSMFVPGFPTDPAGYCTKVKSYQGPEGQIFPDGWCKFYDPRTTVDFDALTDEELAAVAGLDETPKKG